MGVKDLEIIFDNPSKTYNPGETIKGKVNFTFDKPKKILEIICKICGKAYVKWSEIEGKYTRKYKGDKKFFQTKFNLLGNTDEVTVPPGKQTYYFSYTLPLSIPPTFEEQHGYTRYTLKIHLSRVWNIDTVEETFTVVSKLDLNLNPLLKNSVTKTGQVRSDLQDYVSSTLSLTISLPYTGYVPGQKIPVTIEVKNLSSVTVKSVTVSLVKIVTFHTNDHFKTKKEVHEIVCNTVAIVPICQGESKTDTEDIEVPLLPPSDLSNCKRIDLEYEVHGTCIILGSDFHHRVTVPITIGAIPLLLTDSSALSNDTKVCEAKSKSIGWTINAGQPSQDYTDHMDPPPPSYDECIPGITAKVDKNNDGSIFWSKCEKFSPGDPHNKFSPSAPPLE